MLKTQKRLSIRATAMRYGIPTRIVSRALYLGHLSAVKVTTETGRERFYILVDDADVWFNSLSSSVSTVSVGGTK